MPCGAISTPDTRLKAATDLAASKPSSRPFPAALEALYETDGGQSRRRRLAMTLVVAAAAILAGLLLDTPRTPTVLLDHFALRAGATLTLLAAALAARWTRTATREAVLVSMAALTGMGVVEMLGERAPPAATGAYMVSALALVAGIIASGQVRFTTALVACLTCALAFPMVILAFPAALPLHKTPEIPLAAIIGFVVLCLAARRNEIVRRSEYLHRLRHEIGERELHALNRELTRLSATDALTGLANRRHFVDEARRVWDDRDQAPFALAIVDVDDFKAFNDAAGHAAGDRCLSAVAEALNGALRHDSDRAARYGGEEFAILFPGAVNDALPELGERLRAAVEAMRMPHPGRPGSVVTVSVGITWQKGRNGDLDRRLNEADRLMYLAKERGRNRVCAGTSSGEADGGWPAPEQDSGATSPEGVAKTAL